jgi:rhodanese-related sulfurtransferase
MADIPAIDRALEAARSRISPRATASDLANAVADGALVVDTRSAELRRRDGDLEGALAVERNVLEWRLDPTCPFKLAEMDDEGRRVIIVCDEGFASSLAAATLRDLGLTNVTDLEGGYQAWSSYRRSTDGAEPGS